MFARHDSLHFDSMQLFDFFERLYDCSSSPPDLLEILNKSTNASKHILLNKKQLIAFHNVIRAHGRKQNAETLWSIRSDYYSDKSLTQLDKAQTETSAVAMRGEKKMCQLAYFLAYL